MTKRTPEALVKEEKDRRELADLISTTEGWRGFKVGLLKVMLYTLLIGLTVGCLVATIVMVILTS